MTGLAPHGHLERYYKDSATRQTEVDAMFDDSARYYDSVTQWMSFGSGSWYRRDALRRAGVGTGAAVLDTGAGTGAVTLPLQELTGPDGFVVALDPSAGMLAEGRLRGVTQQVRGVGENLPFPDDTFDFVTMGYALRHVGDLATAFAEYRRVLKPGGKVVLLEITRPQNPIGRAILKGYMRYLVPSIAGLFSQNTRVRTVMEYYWDTIEACVPPEAVLAALGDVGFPAAHRHRVLGIFSEYSAVK